MKKYQRIILLCLLALIGGFIYGYSESYATAMPALPVSEGYDYHMLCRVEYYNTPDDWEYYYILSSVPLKVVSTTEEYGCAPEIGSTYLRYRWRAKTESSWSQDGPAVSNVYDNTQSMSLRKTATLDPAYYPKNFSVQEANYTFGSYVYAPVSIILNSPIDGHTYNEYPDIDITATNYQGANLYVDIYRPLDNTNTTWNLVQSFTADQSIWTGYHQDAENIMYPSWGATKIEVRDNNNTIVAVSTINMEMIKEEYAIFQRLLEGSEYSCRPYFYIEKNTDEDVYLYIDGQINDVITEKNTMIHSDSYQIDVGLHQFKLVGKDSAKLYDTRNIKILRDVPEMEPILALPTPTPMVPVPTGPPDDTNIQQYIGSGIDKLIQIATWPFNMVMQGLNTLSTTLTNTVTSFVGTYSAFMSLSGMIFGFLPVEWVTIGTLGIGLSMFLWFVGRK